MKTLNFMASELELAGSIAAGAVRVAPAVQAAIVEAILESCRVPEVRADLAKAATAVGIDLPDDLLAVGPAVGGARSERGARIAAGWQRRREAKAAAEAMESAAGAVVTPVPAALEGASKTATGVSSTTPAAGSRSTTATPIDGATGQSTVEIESMMPEAKAPLGQLARSILPASSRTSHQLPTSEPQSESNKEGRRDG